MNTKTFEKKYKEKGGIAKLTEMRSFFVTLKSIAIHFGVSTTRVKQWMIDFFGERYDPRTERKRIAIERMIEFAKRNEKREFTRAFNGMQHYKQALSECYDKKIYGIER